jgi:A/G-specific adenine glycosylase
MGVRVHERVLGLNTLSSRAKSRDPVAPAKGSPTGPLDFARDDRREFRHTLNRWFLRDKRDLPWRQTLDPYAILVSEIMLQQTQARTVVPYYNRWLRRFPTIRLLAAATESDVLYAWQGLGYYGRARHLHRSAKMIVEKFGGRLPHDPGELKSLPGIGLYTANAIAVFAFDQSLPIVEANTARVLSRLFNIRAPIDSTSGRQKLWAASAKLVPRKNARDFQNAMMDLGALICTAHTPRCQICPVKKFCRADNPASLPRKRKRAAIILLAESHSLSTKAGAVLLEQCRQRWRGMWILPPLKLDGLKPSSLRRPVYVSAFPFTHHRITLRVFRRPVREINTSSQRWFLTNALDAIPIPSPHRRALTVLFA